MSEPTDRFTGENLTYDGADHVVADELRHLQVWRGRAPSVGLALSGGGIRSATYCLGVLQSLAQERALPNVDYLSTVSGGGYIGASLTYLLHQSANRASMGETDETSKFDASAEHFPYVSYPMVSVPSPIEGGLDTKNDSPTCNEQHIAERIKGRLLRKLRLGSNYLTPGGGITILSLIGVIVRNTTVSVIVHIALLLFLFQLFVIKYSPSEETLPASVPTGATTDPGLPASNVFLEGVALALGIYALLSLLYVVSTCAFDSMEREGEARRDQFGPYAIRRVYEVLTHWLFLTAIVLLVIGGLPWLYALLLSLDHRSVSNWISLIAGQSGNSKPVALGIAATLVGLAGQVLGHLQSRRDGRSRIPTRIVVRVASAALLLGLLLLVYAVSRALNQSGDEGINAKIIVGCLVILVLLGWLPEVNYLSLHRYYRDRLLEAFLPDTSILRQDELASATVTQTWSWRRFCGGRSIPGDNAMLGDMCGAPNVPKESDPSVANDAASNDLPAKSKLMRGPYHIINAHVVLVSSDHPRYRARGGDNFILSPAYCGSRATGWKKTDSSPKRGFTLATAMAISGAALNPNTGPNGEGLTRQPLLSVLMGILNLRLGYWNQAKGRGVLMRPNLLCPGLYESLGRSNLTERAEFSLLTDGGHFENLGLYELVRRRLKLIVVCDATADADFRFSALGNAIQKVRADFGAIICIDAEQLALLTPKPHERDGNGRDERSAARQAYLIARIRYANRPGQSSGEETGILILLKATAFDRLPADLYSYRREHPEFPDQSTADQFFDEKQFDAYRELGYMTADQMIKNLRGGLAPDGSGLATVGADERNMTREAADLLRSV